ncbi:MAG: 1-acyl-sn-glycerol-3-phosphate acyltransferase [Bacteroidales bacterium]|nr:1-acyl-sn-glycerol-3-phosphate acyltransferase [Bacteroidales bacterium]
MQISRLILSLAGWNVVGTFPEGIKKAVVIAAPHTSNWDIIIGFLAYRALGIKAKFLVKKEIFFFPLGLLLRAIGGIAIDRSPGNSTVNQVIEQMTSAKHFILTIAPEGTRSPVKEWKSGFWRIAQTTKVPLFLGKIDYKTKTVGLIKEFEITSDFETDITEIQRLYKKEWAKNPTGFVEME